MTPIELTVDTDGDGAAVMHLVGELDVASSPVVRRAVDDLMAAGTRHLVVDLARVDFVDSTGLALLIAIDARLDIAGGSLALSHPNARIRQLIRVAGLDGRLDVTG